MRFTRLLAFATWVVIALLAMAAFAAFSPSEELTGAAPADATVASTGLPPGVGAAAGRQAAFGFSQDMLSLAAPTTTSTTVAPTTTTTTTTVPPTTTTTSSTTTTTLPPSTTATTIRPPTRAPLPPETVYALVEQYFQPEDVERAVLVAWCESRYDASATHPTSGASGLFQHLRRFWDSRSEQAGWAGADIYDPAANTAVAAWLVYSNGGWKHWNASIACWGNGSVVPPSTTTTTTTTLPPTTTTVSPTTVPTTSTTVPSSSTTTTSSTSTTTTTSPPPPTSTTTTTAP